MTSASDLDLRSLEKLSQQLMDNGMKYRSSPNTPGEETKQCLKIFLELGHYLLDRIIQELEEGNTKDVDVNVKEETGDVETEQENTIIPPDSCKIATDTDQLDKIQSKYDQVPPAPTATQVEILRARPRAGLSFPCNECRFLAPNLAVLTGHKKLNHEKEDCKICIKCGYQNFDKKEFKKHLKIVHPKNEKVTQYRNN